MFIDHNVASLPFSDSTILSVYYLYLLACVASMDILLIVFVEACYWIKVNPSVNAGVALVDNLLIAFVEICYGIEANPSMIPGIISMDILLIVFVETCY